MRPIFFSPAFPHKNPQWSYEAFDSPILNRTHMYGPVKAHIKQCLDSMKQILDVPVDREIFFVPGSCSGAMICAFMNFLREECLVYKSGYFSEQFAVDVDRLTKTTHVNKGEEEKFANVNSDRFLVYTDTTRAEKYANFDFLPDVNKTDKITIIDAASALFIEKMYWDKFDVVAGCCQKVLGGDGSLGFLIINKKAIARIDSTTRYIPRLFDIKRWGLETLTEGQIMSTPSVTAFIDLKQSLQWIEINGGMAFLQKRAMKNAAIMEEFIKNNPKFKYFIEDSKLRSSTVASVELSKWHVEDLQAQNDYIAEIAQKAEKMQLFDITNFAMPNWRFWIGPTCEEEDVKEGLNRFKIVIGDN